jgi:Domain of unknown function (DUF4259)
MGAWGAGIFDDDTAADIRGEYREMLEDHVPDDEATRRILSEYEHLDADEDHVLWLALAAAQTQVGRLDDEVKAQALAVIHEGRGLELWEEAGAKELAKRQAHLNKLAERLTGPQPARKTLRRPWHHETDLQPGDVLSFTASNGQMALLRIARIDPHRVGVAPIAEWLDWTGTALPAPWRLKRLKPRSFKVTPTGTAIRPATYRISRHRKKDPDWKDTGFKIKTRLSTRPGDKRTEAWIYCAWTALASDMEQTLVTGKGRRG